MSVWESQSSSSMSGAEIKAAYEAEANTNAYTDAEKVKLGGVAENANNYQHPANHSPSVITQDAGNRFVTDAEKSTWNGKQAALTNPIDDKAAPGEIGGTTPAAGTFTVIKATTDPTTDDHVGDRGYNDLRYSRLALPFNVAAPLGAAGATMGICDPSAIPEGVGGLPGYDQLGSGNFGNYIHVPTGSILCYFPKQYYKIGTGSNGLDVNVIDIKGIDTYADTAAANAAGYALFRAFVNGVSGVATEMDGIFVDKYMCSKVALGTGYVAASIKNGLPISCHADHNPIADLTACSGNYYYETINAAHARDGENGAVNASSRWFVCSRFIYSMLAMMSIAHGQAATSTTNCSWYDSGGITNFPKGCNDNALGDVDDATISYTSDGYSNCGKTGSGTPFNKTTHNGQACGVTDLNGLMWEVSLGLTRPGTSGTDTAQQDDATAFYVLKDTVDIAALQPGWHSGASGAASEAWGDAAHLAVYYDTLTIGHIGNGTGWQYFGNGANQVLSEATSGDGYKFASLGIPKDESAESASGTNLFGKDGIYEYHRANLCLLSCAYWYGSSGAGVWGVNFNTSRSYSSNYVGLRCACFPV